MNRLLDALQAISVTLWAGGLWTVGLIVAPLLFHLLSDRSQAGMLAGQFFAAMAWISLGCGTYLLLFRLGRFGGQAFRQLFFWTVLLMTVLAAAGHFGVQPVLASLKEQALPKEVMESIFRDRFATWHGISSVLYLMQCVLGLALVLLQGRNR